VAFLATVFAMDARHVGTTTTSSYAALQPLCHPTAQVMCGGRGP
jgi:hypothetical protein